MAFWASETLLPRLDAGKQNFFDNFKHYDLANGEE